MNKIQLHKKDIKIIREKILKKNNNICPICGVYIDGNKIKPVLDHDHITGMVRNVLCNACNRLEGKILNYKRFGMSNKRFINFLKNILKYLSAKQTQYIHPNKIKKKRKILLGIRRYKKIKKVWDKIHPRKKIPPFSQKIIYTKKWQIDYEKAEKFLSKG